MSVKQFLMKPTQLSLQQRPSTTAEEFQSLPCKSSSPRGGFRQLWRHKVLPFLHRATTGHRNQHCLSYPQRKTACRELLYTVLQMWGVKNTSCLRCQMHGDHEWHGRIGTGRGGSDMESRSQWPSWELIWGSPLSGTASLGSQMPTGRLWDADTAHWYSKPEMRSSRIRYFSCFLGKQEKAAGCITKVMLDRLGCVQYFLLSEVT